MTSLSLKIFGIALIISLVVLIILSLFTNREEEQNSTVIPLDPNPGTVYVFENSTPEIQTATLNPIETPFEKDGNVDPTRYFWDGGVQLLGANSGKIVVVGQEYVTRYNLDGTRDLTFGTNGWIDISTPPPAMILFFGTNHLLVDSQDRIIISSIEANTNVDLVRLLPNGTVDTSFGTSGYVSNPNVTNGISNHTVIDSNGNIYSLRSDGDLTKYDNTGAIVSSFGTNGTVALDWLGSANLRTWTMKLYQDQIYITCYDDDNQGGVAGAVRYNLDGTKDLTYGTNGNAAVDINPVSGCEGVYIYSSGIAADGSFYMGGSFSADGQTACGGDTFAIVKFLPSGEVDTNFADNGIYLEARSEFYSEDGDYLENYHDITFGLDGNLIVHVTGFPNSGNNFGYILQLTPDGTIIPNTSFPIPPNVTDNFLAWSGFAHPDGRFIVVGESTENSVTSPTVWDFSAASINYAEQTRPW